jgi:hypothetical protein
VTLYLALTSPPSSPPSSRGLLGHARIETTQLYAQIRPAALKQAVEFYEAKALDVLSS